MWQRDITEAEVRAALAQQKDRHFFNRVHGTMNVRHAFPNTGRSLIVAYEEHETEVHIVTVMNVD